MHKHTKREQLFLEIALILVAIALTALTYQMQGYKFVILNLYYLPVVLAGFFLGRYRAGTLALFCVISASLVAAFQLRDFASFASPVAVGLSIAIWGAMLCLTALLVGTLSDEQTSQANELHEAYVGVIEVLSKYLQGSNPQLKARTMRVAELSQAVALEMRLSSKRTDDILVAALMQDLGRIEVTTKVLTRAVDNLEGKELRQEQYSFQGTDLVHSLGTVLRGAIPILLSQDGPIAAILSDDDAAPTDVPIGAKIIRTVRDFDALISGRLAGQEFDREAALRDMRRDQTGSYDPEILTALERVSEEMEFSAV